MRKDDPAPQSVPPAPGMRPAKAALRAAMAAYRAGLDEASYRRRSAAIVDRLRALPELESARTVHCYWPLLPTHEVDIRPLIASLHATKKQIVLPLVRTFSRGSDGTPRLAHVRFTGEGDLRENRWGVFEPSSGEAVPIETLDVVLVPALGAGRNGHRIGHGFGYYDEFLQQVSAPRVCPVYAACLVDGVPAEAHDVPMTVLVTEDEVLRPLQP